LKGSIIFCVSCLFAGMFAQHFSEKLKSLWFAVCLIFFSSCQSLTSRSLGLLPRSRDDSSCWGVQRTPVFLYDEAS
jgi:hypothetical protein